MEPDDTWTVHTVSYQPVRMHVHNARSLSKAIANSNKSVSCLCNILGAYLRAKTDKGAWDSHEHIPNTPQLGYSSVAFRKYHYLMYKLERLSGKILQHDPELRQNLEKALGPFRRHALEELCDHHEIVRCFAGEIPHGIFPKLDDYTLGLRQGQYFFHQIGKSSHGDNPLSLLSKVRTVVLLDDGIAMIQPAVSKEGRVQEETCWSQASRILAGVAPQVCRRNPHGIDIHFMNHKRSYAGLCTGSDVSDILDSLTPVADGYTSTGDRVKDILESYTATLRYCRDIMPLNLLIIMSGAISDGEILFSTIDNHLSTIINTGFPSYQFGMEFIQLGNDRETAAQLVTLQNQVRMHFINFKCDFLGVTCAKSKIHDLTPEYVLALSVYGIDSRLNGRLRELDEDKFGAQIGRYMVLLAVF
jgi:hypothetical protein